MEGVLDKIPWGLGPRPSLNSEAVIAVDGKDEMIEQGNAEELAGLI